MTNPVVSELTDNELATCVDEYVRRAIRIANLAECDKSVTVQIYASRYGVDSEYEIAHKAQIGEYDNTNSVKGNNAIAGMRKCVDRWGADRIEQPTKVQPLLAAPVVTEQHEYAEFAEIDDGEVSADS